MEHAEDGLKQSNLQHAHTLPGVQLPLPPAHPDRSRSIGIRRAHEDARLRSWRHPLVGRCRTNGVTGWAGDHPATPMDIFKSVGEVHDR